MQAEQAAEKEGSPSLKAEENVDDSDSNSDSNSDSDSDSEEDEEENIRLVSYNINIFLCYFKFHVFFNRRRVMLMTSL